jgi:hypothetical protein
MVVATLTKLVPAIREGIFSARNHVTENRSNRPSFLLSELARHCG